MTSHMWSGGGHVLYPQGLILARGGLALGMGRQSIPYAPLPNTLSMSPRLEPVIHDDIRRHIIHNPYDRFHRELLLLVLMVRELHAHSHPRYQRRRGRRARYRIWRAVHTSLECWDVRAVV